MKVGFFDKNKVLKEITRTESDRYTKFLEVISSGEKQQLNEIEGVFWVFINKQTLNQRIVELLKARSLLSPDIPEYKGRFHENEIFETKKFNEKEIKLCNSGKDNTIIFLINLYNSLELGFYVMYAKNYSQISKFAAE